MQPAGGWGTFDCDKGGVKADYDMRSNLRLCLRDSQSRFHAFDRGTIAGTAGSKGDGHAGAPAIQIVGGAKPATLQ